MKLKNLLFVFCLALLAGCQKDPDTESTPVRDTDKVEGVIRMKLDRETAEALNVIRHPQRQGPDGQHLFR